MSTRQQALQNSLSLSPRPPPHFRPTDLVLVLRYYLLRKYNNAIILSPWRFLLAFSCVRGVSVGALSIDGARTHRLVLRK